MPTNTTEVTETKEKIHPLLAREIRPIRNWVELLERWESARTVEEMLGLLHAGFSVSLGQSRHDEKAYDAIDRILFYLSVADGWADSFTAFRKPDDRDIYYRWLNSAGETVDKYPSELRQIIAQKAFDMLCLSIFKSAKLRDQDRDGGFNQDWEQIFTSDRLFPAIRSFFREEECGSFHSPSSIRNLTLKESTSHNEKFAHEFLINLGRFIWGWQKKSVDSWEKRERQQKIIKYNHATPVRLNSAKPWMVQVLAELNRLDVLREWILLLDKTCLTKLRQIALRNELRQYRHPIKKDRRVASLDEACYVGSRAAWFLKEHELVVQEHNRLTAIRDAENQREEADQQIKELAPRQ